MRSDFIDRLNELLQLKFGFRNGPFVKSDHMDAYYISGLNLLRMHNAQFWNYEDIDDPRIEATKLIEEQHESKTEKEGS